MLVGNWGLAPVTPRQKIHHIRVSISGPVRETVSRLLLGTYVGWRVSGVEKVAGGGTGTGDCDISLERLGENPLKVQATVKSKATLIYSAVFALSR